MSCLFSCLLVTSDLMCKRWNAPLVPSRAVTVRMGGQRCLFTLPHLPTPKSPLFLWSPFSRASGKNTDFPLLFLFLESFKKGKTIKNLCGSHPTLVVWKGESIYKTSLMLTWEAIPDCMQTLSLAQSPGPGFQMETREQEEQPLNV